MTTNEAIRLQVKRGGFCSPLGTERRRLVEHRRRTEPLGCRWRGRASRRRRHHMASGARDSKLKDQATADATAQVSVGSF
jgi:hypothetical protein